MKTFKPIHYLNGHTFITKCGIFRVGKIRFTNIIHFVTCENCIKVLDKEEKWKELK
jgi:hypothetical protein